MPTRPDLQGLMPVCRCPKCPHPPGFGAQPVCEAARSFRGLAGQRSPITSHPRGDRSADAATTPRLLVEEHGLRSAAQSGRAFGDQFG